MLTPRYVLEPVRAALGGVIGLDPCTELDNPTGALRFVALPQDGMAIEWRAASVYVNPPYGTAREPWVRRAIEVGQAGTPLALLIPADTDTRLGQAVLRGADAITFVNGRLGFGMARKNGREWRSTHGSMIATWGCDVSALGELGPSFGML